MTSRLTALLALVCAAHLPAVAQEAATVKMEVKDMKVEAQQTPQLQATNLVDKRWKPKTWIEITVDLDTKLARTLGGRDGSVPSAEVKYYLATSGATKDGKRIVLSGTVTYENVPAGESHLLAFVSPSTLQRVLLKDNASKADITGFGIEVRIGGEVVAGKSSLGGQWWVKDGQPVATFAFEEGAVLSKAKTPFAPFWGDYDVPASSK